MGQIVKGQLLVHEHFKDSGSKGHIDHESVAERKSEQGAKALRKTRVSLIRKPIELGVFIVLKSLIVGKQLLHGFLEKFFGHAAHVDSWLIVKTDAEFAAPAATIFLQ